MDRTLIDYQDQARERVTQQFKDKPNVDNLLKIWLDGNQELEQTYLDIEEIKDINEASGVQLDNIGNIIGQFRDLVDISASGYFGFDSDPGAKPFGSIDNNQGGLYYSIDDPETGTIQLSDGFYKVFLRAKIAQNNAGTNAEEIIQVTQAIFDSDIVELFDGGSDANEPAVFTLNIGRDWNDPTLSVFPGLDETQIADRLIPRAAGVRIEYINTQVAPTLGAVENWETASNGLYFTANSQVNQEI